MIKTDATLRRDCLIGWMRERSARNDLTATEIVDVAGIYLGHGRYDRCFDDLKVLERQGLVCRETGRPARWYAR